MDNICAVFIARAVHVGRNKHGFRIFTPYLNCFDAKDSSNDYDGVETTEYFVAVRSKHNWTE